MSYLQKIMENKIVAVIRGGNPENVLPVCKALVAGGVKTLEITVDTPKVISIIEEIEREFGDQIVVGDIHGPLPQIPLMPTGGVDLENVKDYLKAGAVAVGLGGALVKLEAKQQVSDGFLADLSNKAKAFVNAVT